MSSTKNCWNEERLKVNSLTEQSRSVKSFEPTTTSLFRTYISHLFPSSDDFCIQNVLSLRLRRNVIFNFCIISSKLSTQKTGCPYYFNQEADLKTECAYKNFKTRYGANFPYR